MRILLYCCYLFLLLLRPAASGDPYYPIQVGNKWIYICPVPKEDTYYSCTIEVIGDTLFDGTAYFVQRTSYPDNIDSIVYLRPCMGNVFIRTPYEKKKEQLHFPSSDSIGKSFTFISEKGIFNVRVESLLASLITPIKQYDSLVNVSAFNTVHNVRWNYYFKPNVGLVAVKANDEFVAYLTEYKLTEIPNGKK
jgi:hypothetical protein